MKKWQHEIWEEKIFANLFKTANTTGARKRAYTDFLNKVKKAEDAEPWTIGRESDQKLSIYAKVPDFVNDNTQLYALAKLWSCQYKIFSVDAVLAEALWHMDFDVNADSINPPFPSFIIYISDNDSLMYTYLERLEMAGRREPVVMSFERKIEYIVVDTFPFGNHAVVGEGRGYLLGSAMVRFSAGAGGNLTHFAQIPLDETRVSIQDFFRLAEIKGLGSAELAKAMVSQQRIAGFVIAFMLYLSSFRSSVKMEKPSFDSEALERMRDPKKARRLEKLHQGESRHPVYYVGRDYRGTFYYSRQSAMGNGNPLDRRMLVRGHRRDQWYGPKKDEAGNVQPGTHQKEIWIWPFYKGHRFAERADGTVYRVVAEGGEAD